MQDHMKISDRITVGVQPTEEQLKQLAQGGFKTIINLQTAGESEQPLSPEAEGAQVMALRMNYLHIPVSRQAIQPEQVDQFRREICQLPGPVFVHCHTARRAGAFAMMHSAIETGWTGDQTLQLAKQLGFQCDVPALAEFVKDYIDRNRK